MLNEEFRFYGFTVLFLLLLWNLYAFALMGIDKRRAQRNQWRIREKTMFIIAFLWGGIGILSGMQAFRHKTKHTSFRILAPLAVLINILTLFWILRRFVV